jgi:CheY-like chemotaxis protein
MSDSRLKVHVVDDDPAARLFAIAELPDTEWAVSEFGSGSDCIEGLDQFPDVVLLDVGNPEMNAPM